MTSRAPVEHFCTVHGLRTADFAKLAEKGWQTVQKWRLGQRTPTLDDALRVVGKMRAINRTASLNDFDPEAA